MADYIVQETGDKLLQETGDGLLLEQVIVPIVVSTSENSGTVVGTTGITVTKPADLEDGDVMYAFTTWGQNEGGATTSTGWTLIKTESLVAGTDQRLTCLRKVVTDASGEAADYDFVNTDVNTYGFTGIIMAVRYLDNTTPEDAETTVAEGANDDTPDSPSITTVNDNAMIVTVCSLSNLNVTLTLVAPSGFNLEDTSQETFRAQTAVATDVQTSAGASGANNWPNTGGTGTSEFITFTLALRKAVTVDDDAENAIFFSMNF